MGTVVFLDNALTSSRLVSQFAALLDGASEEFLAGRRGTFSEMGKAWIRDEIGKLSSSLTARTA
jgi:hypothetical protein